MGTRAGFPHPDRRLTRYVLAMNHWDRLQEQLRGNAPDCLPIALWRHWPDVDDDPRALAMATMRWQRRYDFDLVRYMPSSTVSAEHWGAGVAYRANVYGTKAVERHAVTAPEQWRSLRPAGNASLAACNDGVKQVADALGGTVPLLQTVTSPLLTAWELAGDALFDHMQLAPDAVESALAGIAEESAAFAVEAIRSGACGIALVVDRAVANRMTRDAFARFGCSFDRRVLDAIRTNAQLSMLDFAGDASLFDAYPVEILNPRGPDAAPGRVAVRGNFKGILAAGLDPEASLGTGSRAQVDDDIGAAILQLAGGPAMIAASGPCRMDTPEANIDGAVDAVRRRANLPPEEKPS